MIYFFGNAQETRNTLTLEESIELALKNNPDLQRVELTEDRSKINYRQSITNLLPDLNGDYNIGVSTGRSIDPFTNAYINQELTFSNAGLRLNAVVFNGFLLLNRIRQNKLNLKASEMEVEAAKENLVLNVTLAYLQVLNNQDLTDLAENRVATTSEQVNRLETLYDEEVGNPADYTDIQGQLANDRAGVLQAQTSLQEALLNLAELLNVDYEIDLAGIDLLVDLEKYPYSAEEIYEESLKNLATFKAREFQVRAAKKGVSVARSLYFPEISFFGQLNTNYSSAAQVFLETGTNRVETGSFITINDEVIPVFADQPLFEGEGISYRDQFENNISTAIGLSVSIPIFNGLQARNNVALEKIDLEEATIILEDTRLQFRQAIILAYNEMEAAFERIQILQEQVAAYEESFRINEIRFNSGVSTIVEYTISKNNLENAKINLANARYEYLLRVKVLDYYRGV